MANGVLKRGAEVQTLKKFQFFGGLSDQFLCLLYAPPSQVRFFACYMGPLQVSFFAMLEHPSSET